MNSERGKKELDHHQVCTTICYFKTSSPGSTEVGTFGGGGGGTLYPTIISGRGSGGTRPYTNATPHSS